MRTALASAVVVATLFSGAAMGAGACGARAVAIEGVDSGADLDGGVDTSETCVRHCAFRGVECDVDTRCVRNGGACSYRGDEGCSPETRTCIDTCLRPKSLRCDSAGCCEIVNSGGVIITVKLVAICNNWTLDDPNSCPTCIPVWEPPPEVCGECEWCLGKTELPPHCYGDAGVDGAADG